jgi:SM-20-related protein
MGLRNVLGPLSEQSIPDDTLLTSRERELLSNILREIKSSGTGPDTEKTLTAILARAVGETLMRRASEVAGRDVLRGIESQLAEREFDGASEKVFLASPPPPATGPRPPSPSGPGPGRPTMTEHGLNEQKVFMSSPPPPATGPRPPSPSGPGPGRFVMAEHGLNEQKVFMSSPPPPATGPRPPSPSGPGPGRFVMAEHGLNEQKVFMSSPPPPATGPRPPSPSGPGPRLDRDVAMMSHSNSAGVADDSQVLRAECVVFEEFLAPEELKTLTQYALGREGDFRISEVLSPGVMGTVVDAEHRRSRVLMDLGNYERLFRDRIEAALPRVLEKLGMQKFPITRFESQLTASNDGDFFRHHFDNAEEEIASRQLTYVYFFHREPKAFQGGELRLHDAERRDGSWVTAGSYKAVVPEQNQIVFFPSSLLHEITPVVCPSRAFADSRFTVNGWLHR